jgi:hypothetical protein
MMMKSDDLPKATATSKVPIPFSSSIGTRFPKAEQSPISVSSVFTALKKPTHTAYYAGLLAETSLTILAMSAPKPLASSMPSSSSTVSFPPPDAKFMTGDLKDAYLGML